MSADYTVWKTEMTKAVDKFPSMVFVLIQPSLVWDVLSNPPNANTELIVEYVDPQVGLCVTCAMYDSGVYYLLSKLGAPRTNVPVVGITRWAYVV